jgi:hypothetical protein
VGSSFRLASWYVWVSTLVCRWARNALHSPKRSLHYLTGVYVVCTSVPRTLQDTSTRKRLPNGLAATHGLLQAPGTHIPEVVLAGCPLVPLTLSDWCPLQGSTVRFLAYMVQGCSVESEPLIEGMLLLALELNWWNMNPQVVLLAVPLFRRLAEAADAGRFSSPESPLASLASKLARKLLPTACKSRHWHC